jgi:hypothetical protein
MSLTRIVDVGFVEVQLLAIIARTAMCHLSSGLFQNIPQWWLARSRSMFALFVWNPRAILRLEEINGTESKRRIEVWGYHRVLEAKIS